MSAGDDGVEPIAFCRRWNTITATPIDPLTAAEAEEMDRSKQWYTVVVGDPSAPRCYVEVAWENDHAGVWFLDEGLRQSVHYSFTRLDETMMFLDSVVLWSYPRAAGRSFDEASTIEAVEYTTEGLVRRTTTNVRKKKDKIEEFSDVPLDINWEPVPAFGDYRSLTRLDREPN